MAKETFFTKILPGLSIAILIGVFGLVFKIYINNNFTQPQVDKDQNEKCITLEKTINNLAVIVNRTDSMSKYRDKGLNERQNQLYDILKPMSIKMDIILNNDKKSKKEFDDIKKYLLPGNIAERPKLILDTIENFTQNN